MFVCVFQAKISKCFKRSDFLHSGVYGVEKLENEVSFSKFGGLKVEKSENFRIFKKCTKWSDFLHSGVFGVGKLKK